jgi:RNA polymerase sigma factor (sigma-70 family)
MVTDDLDRRQTGQPTVPLRSGQTGNPDSLPGHAAFLKSRIGSAAEDHDVVSIASPGQDPIEEYSSFYKESVPRLIAFLRWQGVPLAEASDCAQEALIKALPPKWETIERPYAWCRIAAWRIYQRRVSRCREVPTGEVELTGCPLIAPGTDIEDFEKRHQVLQWVEQLPPRQRQVMAWAYDGASPAETAEELGMNASTVRSTLRHARTALSRILNDEGGVA